MSDGGAIEAQRANYNRRSHACPCWTSHCFGVADASIRRLHQPVEQGTMGFHGRCSSKAAKYFLDCCSGGNLALPLPTNSVCQCKQPSVRADLIRRGRQDVTEIVLVSGTDRTRIRELRELYLQHRSTRCII